MCDLRQTRLDGCGEQEKKDIEMGNEMRERR